METTEYRIITMNIHIKFYIVILGDVKVHLVRCTVKYNMRIFVHFIFLSSGIFTCVRAANTLVVHMQLRSILSQFKASFRI